MELGSQSQWREVGDLGLRRSACLKSGVVVVIARDERRELEAIGVNLAGFNAPARGLIMMEICRNMSG